MSVLGDGLDTEFLGKIGKPSENLGILEFLGKIGKPLEKFGDFSKSLTSVNAPFIQWSPSKGLVALSASP